MKMTNHAEKRMQQRGLTNPISEIIVNNGYCEKAPGGAERYSFREKEYRKAMLELNMIKKNLERAKNGIVVMKDDHIITLYKNDNPRI